MTSNARLRVDGFLSRRMMSCSSIFAIGRLDGGVSFYVGLTLFVCYGLMEVLFVFAKIALVECLLGGGIISGGLVVGKTTSGRLVPLVACLPLVLSCFGASHLSTVWSLLLGAVIAVRQGCMMNLRVLLPTRMMMHTLKPAATASSCFPMIWKTMVAIAATSTYR